MSMLQKSNEDLDLQSPIAVKISLYIYNTHYITYCSSYICIHSNLYIYIYIYIIK